jgi:hypothetical protein
VGSSRGSADAWTRCGSVENSLAANKCVWVCGCVGAAAGAGARHQLSFAMQKAGKARGRMSVSRTGWSPSSCAPLGTHNSYLVLALLRTYNPLVDTRPLPASASCQLSGHQLPCLATFHASLCYNACYNACLSVTTLPAVHPPPTPAPQVHTHLWQLTPGRRQRGAASPPAAPPHPPGHEPAGPARC